MCDPFSLAGKRILVTGASSGIGRQVALACAARGATMVVSGRDETRLANLLDELDGDGHVAEPADLADDVQLDRLGDAVGEVDGVFYSSGLALIAPFRMITPGHIKRIMRVDLDAAVLLVQRLLKQRRIRNGGSIVFNTSVSARLAPAGSAIYSAAKAALDAAARSLALEVARARIRVNTVHFGYIRTRLLDDLAKGGMNVDEMTALAPLGMGSVDDAACAAVFLLSDASRWISRTTLTCDGGLSVRMV